MNFLTTLYERFQVGSSIFASGSIGLIPRSMTIIPQGIKAEAHLALRHVDRVLKAIDSSSSVQDAICIICYVVSASYIAVAEDVFRDYNVSTGRPTKEQLFLENHGNLTRVRF